VFLSDGLVAASAEGLPFCDSGTLHQCFVFLSTNIRVPFAKLIYVLSKIYSSEHLCFVPSNRCNMANLESENCKTNENNPLVS
jgi:hypothetical protein